MHIVRKSLHHVKKTTGSLISQTMMNKSFALYMWQFKWRFSEQMCKTFHCGLMMSYCADTIRCQRYLPSPVQEMVWGYGLRKYPLKITNSGAHSYLPGANTIASNTDLLQYPHYYSIYHLPVVQNLSVNPGWHSQANPPVASTQRPFSPQGLLWHSSIS